MGGLEMKDFREYEKKLIEFETSVQAGTHSVREAYDRAAKKGVSNVKFDRGGATLVGVTYNTYKKIARLYGWPEEWEGFVSMTYEEWETIVYFLFFEIQGSHIKNQSLALALFDFYWHSGTHAVKVIQKLVNTRQDGILGPKTLAAINFNDARVLHLKLTYERLKFLENLAGKDYTQRGFLEGWKNRISFMTFES